MDPKRPDMPTPTTNVVPIRGKRVTEMGRLDENAKMPPPGFRVASLEIVSPTGKVLERLEFDPDGKPRKG